jgi:hypothetical protein
VRTLAPHTEADPAALAIEFLCLFGVMAGPEVGQRPHAVADGSDHPARLNPLIVGKTARARKSTAFNQIRNLFFAVDSDFMSTQLTLIFHEAA